MAVVYLTGAPATGKSTLSRNLRSAFPDLLVFSYSERLRELLASRADKRAVREDEIRAKSASLVTPADIRELDETLIDLVATERRRRSVLIDSHPVTKEAYGFRVTGFSVQQLQQLSPDVIVCLYASSEMLIDRIRVNAMGRPLPTAFEADMHTLMQGQLAVQYGILLGKPVYLFDSAVPQAELVQLVARKSGIEK